MALPASTRPIQPTATGVLLHIKARPNSTRTSFTGYSDDVLSVDISAAPDKDKANDSLLRYLSSLFSVPRSSVRLIRGRASRHKTVEIATQATVETMLLTIQGEIDSQ